MGAIRLTYHNSNLIASSSLELANHLGNVLSVISDKVIPHPSGGSVAYYKADILQAQDYSPFGVKLKGRNLNKNLNVEFYRSGFQGQEEDDELKGDGNSLNYTYRMHDPRLGRFFAIDPLARKFPWNSNYAFSENKVIAFVELEGLETYYAADGSYLGTIGTSSEIRIVNDAYIKQKGSKEKTIENIQKIQNGINSGYEKSNAHLDYLNTKASNLVTVEDASEDFQKMWKKSKDNNRELSATIVLDVKNFKLTVEVDDFDPNSHKEQTFSKYSAGEAYGGDPNKIAIANVHTHPTEDTYLGKRTVDGKIVTDNYNFNNQYSVPGGDGNHAKTFGDIYTIAGKNVDFFSNEGRSSSKNNLTTRKNLEAGSFNLLTHALRNYKK